MESDLDSDTRRVWELLPDPPRGRYNPQQTLGVGSHGRVILARDRELDREVVVKLVPVEESVEIRRFLREGRVLATIRHPCIVSVLDFGIHHDVGYLVQPYEEGLSLYHTMRRDGALPWVEVARMIRDIASALDSLHDRGVVHRDLKPANILVTHPETVDEPRRYKLIDFGLVRGRGDSVLTGAGVLTGTLLYVPPERFRGVELDPRSDLYSLGTTAYEALVGRNPFEASSIEGVREAHLTRVIRDLPPTPAPVPQDLEELIVDLLRKVPDERPRSASEVADRAEEILRDRPPGASMRIDRARPTAPLRPLPRDVVPPDFRPPSTGRPLIRRMPRRILALAAGATLCLLIVMWSLQDLGRLDPEADRSYEVRIPSGFAWPVSLEVQSTGHWDLSEPSPEGPLLLDDLDTATPYRLTLSDREAPDLQITEEFETPGFVRLDPLVLGMAPDHLILDFVLQGADAVTVRLRDVETDRVLAQRREHGITGHHAIYGGLAPGRTYALEVSSPGRWGGLDLRWTAPAPPAGSGGFRWLPLQGSLGRAREIRRHAEILESLETDAASSRDASVELGWRTHLAALRPGPRVTDAIAHALGRTAGDWDGLHHLLLSDAERARTVLRRWIQEPGAGREAPAIMAVHGLAAAGTGDADLDLIAHIAGSRHPAVRRAALTALALAGSDASRARVMARLEAPAELDADLLWSAALAGDRRAAGPVTRTLEMPGAPVEAQVAAVIALGLLEARDGLGPVRAAARSVDTTLHEAATWTLGWLRDPDLAGVLEARVRSGASLSLVACWALARLPGSRAAALLEGPRRDLVAARPELEAVLRSGDGPAPPAGDPASRRHPRILFPFVRFTPAEAGLRTEDVLRVSFPAGGGPVTAYPGPLPVRLTGAPPRGDLLRSRLPVDRRAAVWLSGIDPFGPMPGGAPIVVVLEDLSGSQRVFPRNGLVTASPLAPTPWGSPGGFGGVLPPHVPDPARARPPPAPAQVAPRRPVEPPPPVAPFPTGRASPATASPESGGPR